MNWLFSKRVIKRSIPWIVSTAIAAILSSFGAFQPLEHFVYNRFTNWRFDRNWDERLVIIAIDDASIEKLGRFPWTRDRYIPLIQKLTKASASTVAINLIWSEPSSADALLAKVMSDNRQVVLSQAWNAQGKILLPVPQLGEAAIGTGHILEPKSRDGIVRWAELYKDDVPSLAMATIQAHNLVWGNVPMPNPDLEFGINWTYRSSQMRQYSFVDVIEERIPLSTFQNKIVLVGVTATGNDALVTPFDGNDSAHSVHLHANILQNLLQQNQLRVPEIHWAWGLLLLVGMTLAWILGQSKIFEQIVIVIVISGVWGICTFGFYILGYWLPVAMPITLIMSIGLFSIVQNQIESRQHLQQINSKLSYEALHDHLTGLANRVSLIDRINHAISLYQRHGYLFAVILVDLDGFKAINDNLGHLNGDRLLIEVAKRLNASIRTGDTAARLGGDEFVVLLDNLKEKQDAIITIERIQAAMAPTCCLDGNRINISMSMGMAFGVESYRIPKDILADADIAMYQAKSLGKSRYQVFDGVI
jgi:diguanylate cyclase (GGDEF)-like protein